MQTWINKRRIAFASLLVAGLSAQAGSPMSPPGPLGTARADRAAVTADQAAVARTNARYLNSMTNVCSVVRCQTDESLAAPSTFPEPARAETLSNYSTIAPTNAPTSDPTAVAKSSYGRYTNSAGARTAARAKFCANLKLTHDWAAGILAGRWSQDVMVEMLLSEINGLGYGCSWTK